MSAGPVTTEAILAAAVDTMGLPRPTVLTLVAKSATVRYLATHDAYKDRFVLKGGTLLTNVYRSPRQSVADADYTYVDPPVDMTLDDVTQALTIEGDYGFTLVAEEGVWTTDRALFDGDSPFEMDGIKLSPKPRERQLKVTVSVRPGERLDPPEKPLIYSDTLLAEHRVFAVNGLTVNELAAEKILGWCSKGLVKHALDLAYIGRELNNELDKARVAELVKDKFEQESGAFRYRNAGIGSTRDIADRFLAEDQAAFLHEDWNRFESNELFLLPKERDRDDDEALTSSTNIERLMGETWQETLERLRSF